jgi:inositol transport system permease protein
MILQVSVIGIIAVGVTQVIITGGIDLSSGSVVGMTAMIAASFAQSRPGRGGLSGADRSARSIMPIARRACHRAAAG